MGQLLLFLVDERPKTKGCFGRANQLSLKISASLKSQYKAAVQQDIAESATGVMNRPNNVAHYQRLFQENDGQPIFLKKKGDMFLYRNMMRASVVGIGISFVFLGLLATGKMKK